MSNSLNKAWLVIGVGLAYIGLTLGSKLSLEVQPGKRYLITYRITAPAGGGVPSEVLDTAAGQLTQAGMSGITITPDKSESGTAYISYLLTATEKKDLAGQSQNLLGYTLKVVKVSEVT